MTVIASVKTCLASVGAQASLSSLSLNSQDEESKRVFHECMLEMDSIIADLQNRVSVLEREEPQYKRVLSRLEEMTMSHLPEWTLVILRSVFILIILFAITKWLGKRQISQPF